MVGKRGKGVCLVESCMVVISDARGSEDRRQEGSRLVEVASYRIARGWYSGSVQVGVRMLARPGVVSVPQRCLERSGRERGVITRGSLT